MSSRAPVREPERWSSRRYSLVSRLEVLARRVGLEEFVEKGDLVAVKVHFGDRGTTRMLRSIYVRRMVELVREAGGRPFVTETTGLGMLHPRSTAVGRLETARDNGYTQETLGAPVVIADGLTGFDYRVHAGVEVASAIAEADKLLVLSHLTGHFTSGFGGAIKHLGLGCVAKPAKFRVHIQGMPEIDAGRCTLCGRCAEVCPGGAISPPEVAHERCVMCAGCGEACPEGAVRLRWLEGREICRRVAASARGVVEAVGRENVMFFSFLLEVTPHCDCCAFSDNPIVPDIGVLASADAVAVDAAALELVRASPGLPASMLPEEALPRGREKFEHLFQRDARVQIEEGERLGLGTSEFSVVEVG